MWCAQLPEQLHSRVALRRCPQSCSSFTQESRSGCFKPSWHRHPVLGFQCLVDALTPDGLYLVQPEQLHPRVEAGSCSLFFKVFQQYSQITLLNAFSAPPPWPGPSMWWNCWQSRACMLCMDMSRCLDLPTPSPQVLATMLRPVSGASAYSSFSDGMSIIYCNPAGQTSVVCRFVLEQSRTAGCRWRLAAIKMLQDMSEGGGRLM